MWPWNIAALCVFMLSSSGPVPVGKHFQAIAERDKTRENLAGKWGRGREELGKVLLTGRALS